MATQDPPPTLDTTMPAMDEPTPPASTRLPTELRLLIWTSYFANLHFVPSTPLAALPLLENRIASIAYLPKHVTSNPSEIELTAPLFYSTHKPLIQTEPALLQTCRLYRSEALPIYLEYLKREKQRLKGRYLRFLRRKMKKNAYDPTRSVARSFSHGLTVLEVTVAAVERELEGMVEGGEGE